jgi:hypothetical protein
MKRKDLISQIKKPGVYSFVMAVDTIGIGILRPAHANLFLDIARSKNIWPGTSSRS